MANLYELASEFAALQQAAANDVLTDEELTQILDDIDESRTDLRTKVDNICRLLSNLNAEAEALHTEERRLGARRKTLENKVERLRDWVRSTMELVDVKEIKTGLHVVTIAEGPPSVIITNPNIIPGAYLKTTTTPKKAEILAAYKQDGEIIAGTDIVRGVKLTIR